MSIRVALHHRTRYVYDRPVQLSPHVVRLRPAPHARTPVTGYSLRVLPAKQFINWQQDPYSNYHARLVFPEPARELNVEVDLVADLTVINPFDFFLEPSAEKCPFVYDAVVARELAPYFETLPAGPRLAAWLASVDRTPVRTVDFLVALNQRLHKDIQYIIRMEPGVQSCEQTLTLRSGSCRDSAWLLVQILRHLGLAARFVSGYLIQLVADVKALDGPSGTDRDFTDLHAWTEVYLPGAGWIGLDPTSGLFTGEGHIPLACTADPQTAAPITGSFTYEVDPAKGEEDKAQVEFSFEMTVRRIHEDPRVTKPYTDEQWARIEALGHAVDADLARGDVRLTMGGEPTFVSVDDMDGAEWNTAALGPHKRQLAGQLFRRLRDQFAPHALLHFGQGKWYPGESLPRWALGCYWRKDGQPIWENPALIADDDRHYGANAVVAQRFAQVLAQRLGVDPRFALPGFEDAWYYLWKERRLPGNVDPFDSRLENPEDRARLARVFERGLSAVVGYALPLQRWYYPSGPQWVSGAWFFRPERMYLIPGDSPMGFRLPLDSLPWLAPGDRHTVIAQDPMDDRPPLPPKRRFGDQPFLRGAELPRRGAIQEQGPPGPERPGPSDPAAVRPGDAPNAPWIIRTALCVEPRDGRLHVFMPPVRYLEDYLDLVACIENTAESLATPVQIEGYGPPADHRLNHFKITPDPGVIEVNIHPSASWDELVRNTTVLYEQARLSRLGTEKFMLDGRHTGTGGGNHVIIGGATPLDSPVLRRPHLLRSLVGYWHNHPSLSYLFSTLFLGPTSQAPRVDEARNDALYELEVAFRQIPENGSPPPWLVDRVFRNLLVDVTGNTHRAEFCIDKLYSPDGPGGRHGLVELRAFEMPPHARMSLVQQVLLRSLVARFWDRPYAAPLVRWGTELHDRFMLPHFVQQDMEDVVADLQQAGYPLQAEWFAPFQEFRFPFYGEIVQRGVRVELRQALEPWHVLGEEPGGGGTVRYVDSSVERLQVKVEGLVDSRHVLTCNGRRLPLHPTGTVGEYVCGVRYRAWQPPSCLHPTIGVHAPLVVDVLDTWNGRSIGGCTYHVAHPGGRAYDQFPVNAYEAQSRRVARFFAFGHTPGAMAVPPEEPNREFPFTLDLRRPAAAGERGIL